VRSRYFWKAFWAPLPGKWQKLAVR